MNRYKRELDKLTVPESAVETLMKKTAHPRNHSIRLKMVLAACLVVLCSLGVAAVAKAYTGWFVGDVKRFKKDEYFATHPYLSDIAKEYAEQKDGYYEVYATAEYDAFVFEPNVLVYLTDQALQDGQSIDFRSLTEMNEALGTKLLDSSMLIPMEDKPLCVCISPLDDEGSNLQLLGAQSLLVDGCKDIFCHYSFDLYTCEGTGSRVGISLEEDTFSFSQMELESLQVTAEVITFDESEHVMVCFTKDGIPYKLAFHLREDATSRKVDMNAVTEVLESLR